MCAAIVIDSGSSWCRAGYAGESDPEKQFSSVISGSAKSPIERGVVTDWDAMKSLLTHTFSELKTSADQRFVLLTDSPTNPKPNREKLTEIMFESFKTPAMHVANSSVLALFSSGRTTGIVLESGGGVSHAVPIHDGYSLPQAIGRLDLAGEDLTQHMAKILTERGVENAANVAGDIKEKKGFISIDFESDMEKEEVLVEYALPDGKSVSIGKEVFRGVEPLFRPSLLGSESSVGGIQRLAYDSIKKCEASVQDQMYANLVPSGGSTQFAGFDERLEKEMKALAAPAGPSTKVRPIAAARQLGPWIGGSILASLSTFDDKWIRKAEYEESGSSVVHTKCA